MRWYYLFDTGSAPVSIHDDTDTGYYGDAVGVCPLCGKTVVKGKYYYGCSGYKDGCAFKVGINICGRNISVSNARLLLALGTTELINGFVSPRTGKQFNGRLVLNGDRAVFDFSPFPQELASQVQTVLQITPENGNKN